MTTLWTTCNLCYIFYFCHKVGPAEPPTTEELVMWEQWGACTGTCGVGHRSRTGCMEMNHRAQRCQSSTEETGDCSLLNSCSSSSLNIQGQMTPSVKRSSAVDFLPSSLPVTESLKTMSSTSSTAHSQTKISSLVTSTRLVMTSRMIPLIPTSGSSSGMTSSAEFFPGLPHRVNTSAKQVSKSDIKTSTTQVAQETQKATEHVNNQGVPNHSQAQFSMAKNKVLLNHTIDDMWTSSEVKCAILCLRNPDCRSFNFKVMERNLRQDKDINLEQLIQPNCLLNAVAHRADAKDLIVSEGWTYFHRVT
ncbi:uncharacterized protein [Montipora capricornis]|uniref:uncharacterized protein isoform X1 n=1 Tax=Montipora capricornis TaxID=246305 RepID=UPI0035F1FA3B